MNEPIKRIALNAFQATNPVNVFFGKVLEADPLEIEVHSKLKLTEEFLIVSEHLTRHERVVTVEYEYPRTWDKEEEIGDEQKESESRRRPIGGSDMIPYEEYEMKFAKLIFEDGLKKDDKVILVRVQGGHQFIVWDRYREGEYVWSYPLER